MIEKGKHSGDWRGAKIDEVRELIFAANPEIVEEVKWKKPSNPAGVPVWSCDGMICTGEIYKDKVKLTFAKGAALDDPDQLFNASLDGNARRAIDLFEGDKLKKTAFKKLIRAAVALNQEGKARVKKTTKSKSGPKLLSGGNPQVAKADGDKPVQEYIAAIPGWKRKAGQELDALISRTVPKVRKAVRWNSPFYGIEGKGWFLSFHCFTKYIKVGFFNGTSLKPMPPVESKHDEARYLHIHENDELDEKLVSKWLKQAAKLPGWGKADA